MLEPNEAPTLVLVHGAGGSATIWDRLIAALGGRWRSEALDLPGHGGAPGPGRESIEAYATWLEALLISRFDPPLVLAGHSMGGAIAQLVARRQRVALAGLILIGTGARLPVTPELLAGLRASFESTVRRVAELAYAPSAPAELRLDDELRLTQAGPDVVARDFEACDAFDLSSQVGRIELPTLILCGAEDQLTPPPYSQTLAAGIHGARLVLIPGAGHMLPVEQPLAVAGAVDDFLAELFADAEGLG